MILELHRDGFSRHPRRIQHEGQHGFPIIRPNVGQVFTLHIGFFHDEPTGGKTIGIADIVQLIRGDRRRIFRQECARIAPQHNPIQLLARAVG